MATIVAGNIVQENLVFAYDTGYGVASNHEATRFYSGKPISNTINGGANRANAVTSPMHASHGASVTTEIISYGNRKNVFRIYSTNTSGYYMVNQQSSIINTSGNVYTYSFDYKKIKGTNSSFSPSAFYKNGYKTPDSGSAASSVTDTIVDLEDGWKRLTRTYTSSYTGYNLYRTNLNTDNTLDFEYLFDNFMVNEGVATPFVDSTRSSTASLIDLTKTTDIDVSNISFDSTGQPVFDGTNDYIAITDASKFYTNTWSWEMVVKFDSNNGSHQGLVWGEGTSSLGSGTQYLITLYNYQYFHYRVQNSTTGWSNVNVNINFTPTDYNHVVWQFNNGTTNIYINGELLNTESTRGSYSGLTTQPLYIGARNDLAYDFNGKMPVLKFHNSFLTAQEVKQNYNAQKNRFI